ncbi:Hypothetical predicted protein [Olea europaea subsp. europaea]|uniref:Uncharacterized protein n=1 Tax=Olea europaea subsp. europaea TaxID=158383 RepID=A0A8S0VDV9_OLEEU|nr:Hypothetical predicted protein [Olea europaea subsp. europaea]
MALDVHLVTHAALTLGLDSRSTPTWHPNGVAGGHKSLQLSTDFLSCDICRIGWILAVGVNSRYMPLVPKRLQSIAIVVRESSLKEICILDGRLWFLEILETNLAIRIDEIWAMFLL